MSTLNPVRPPVDLAVPNKVRNPLPVPKICPNCGAGVVLVKNSEIYGREFGQWPYAYLCKTRCSYVGIHPGTTIPLGTMADAETRAARKNAKQWFEPLWKGRRTRFTKRTGAYAWLAARLGIPVAECHFGWFDKETAERAGRICKHEAQMRG